MESIMFFKESEETHLDCTTALQIKWIRDEKDAEKGVVKLSGMKKFWLLSKAR